MKDMRIVLILFFFGLISSFTNSASAQSDSDIYLFEIEDSDDGLRLVKGRNVIERKGYDNQPSFHPSKPLIYFSSFDDNDRSDIKVYNFETDQTTKFTETEVREYSPTVTPDGKFISCIIQFDDGAQDLAKYPIDGGEAITLIDDLKVGYHAWASNSEVLLFILRDTMDLYFHKLDPYEGNQLSENVGRALHKIPGQESMSFVQKNEPELDEVEQGAARTAEQRSATKEKWKIMRFDLSEQKISEVAETLPGREDLAWYSENVVFMSDGKDIFSMKVAGEGEARAKLDWQKLDMGDIQLTGVTRLVVSPDRKHLAVVADE